MSVVQRVEFWEPGSGRTLRQSTRLRGSGGPAAGLSTLVRWRQPLTTQHRRTAPPTQLSKPAAAMPSLELAQVGTPATPAIRLQTGASWNSADRTSLCFAVAARILWSRSSIHPSTWSASGSVCGGGTGSVMVGFLMREAARWGRGRGPICAPSEHAPQPFARRDRRPNVAILVAGGHAAASYDAQRPHCHGVGRR